MPKGKEQQAGSGGEQLAGMAGTLEVLEGATMGLQDPPSSWRSASIDQLTAAVARVMGAMGATEHDATNTQHGYKYTSFDAMAGKLRSLLAKEGLAIFPVSVIVDGERDVQFAKGPWHCERILVTYAITHGPSGQWMQMQCFGEGADNTDKQIPKATTMAEKYLLKQLFLISTGGDDAAADERIDKAAAQDVEPDIRREKVTPEQAAEVQALADKTKTDTEKMLAHHRIKEFGEMTVFQCRQALAVLRDREKVIQNEQEEGA